MVTAWRAARRGLRVSVVAPQSRHAASVVAAGMLTPATEAAYGEEALTRFGLVSRDRYPGFLAELAADGATEPGYRTGGTLQVAFDTDDLARLAELGDLRARLGIATRRLTGRECRRLEPMLAPSVRGGFLAPDDHSVDPRRLLAALRAAARGRGVALLPVRATAVELAGGAVRGVRLERSTSAPDAPPELRAPQVVLAAGAWTGGLAGVPDGVLPELRPVKGQLLRLRTPPGEAPPVSRTVRGLVRGAPVYLVPRDDGEVVLGATQEEAGHDTRLTVGGVWELLRDARELVPGVSELEIAETCVGLRPGSPDNEPLLGPTRVPGLHLAVGHFRHGVLFTPATGDAMAAALADGRLPDFARRFAATRAVAAGAAT
ncbi:glycine oxidase ThiO [Marinitenerispora sediminis]|uniref:glycine oxidase n=1 Tax=Marinitenerispora sediminis TaxID=1931232 RepID=A0A368TBZ0_9ACTN|nr:glycine oxidase ThiO [Marinitenerispora sediminis]RCV55295.1 glycine oxidase ThiO [Marinitenerispora sediminis]RCV61688.1 glycine oxidase ThiO [Marinitenerispora sediminis]RCV62669.1 glycine oxidase ThiO [Marinitenerispora sediminis]